MYSHIERGIHSYECQANHQAPAKGEDMQTQQNASLYLLYNGRYVGWCASTFALLQVAERYSIDTTELLTDFIENNSVAHMLRNMYIYKQVS